MADEDTPPVLVDHEDADENGGSPAFNSSSTLINIIDENSAFTADEAQLKKWMAEYSHITDDYSIVAIMGSQSSGKSTLLNLVFGTEFDVMDDSTLARSQTTRGIWLGASPKVPNVMLLDLEGTDSEERGEDRGPFERQSALFALAMSEVLIININYADIGRYVASNRGVLKTIFEVNLQLFSSNISKTKLLFLLRDVPQQRDLSVLEEQVRSKLPGIWEEISKPAQFKDSPASDFFDVDFHALAHKLYMEEDFMRGVATLQNRFLSPSAPEGYIFDLPYHLERSRSVPPDGLSHYSAQVWQAIKEQKDLDLPSQKALLAQFRCDEILQASWSVYREGILETSKAVKKSFVDGFAATAKPLFEKAMEQYTELASRYDKDISDRKRSQLEEKILEDLHGMFATQSVNAQRSASDQFQRQLAADLPSNGAHANFREHAKKCTANAWEHFDQRIQDSLVTDVWDVSEYRDALTDYIGKHTETIRLQQLKLLIEEGQNLIRNQLVKEVASIFNRAQDDVWEAVHKERVVCSKRVRSILDTKLPGLVSGDSSIRSDLETACVLAIREEAKKQLGFIQQILQKRFDSVFKRDEDGLPRKWHKDSDTRIIFKKGREQAINLLRIYSQFKSPESSDNLSEEDRQLLSTSEQAVIEERFLSAIQQDLVEADRIVERYNTKMGPIPPWALVVMAVLGFDEFIWILSNPFLLVLLLMAGGGFVVCQKLGMLGTVKRIIANALQDVMAQAQQFIAPPPSTTPPRSAPARASDSKKQD